MRYRCKTEWVGKYIRGKRVLDLGCVDHSLNRTIGQPWLHGFIARNAASVVGVDTLPDQVAEMNRRGFTAICADVETMDLGERFDVIVAGDIIEHLSNPGALIRQAVLHLAPSGMILITTPNPVTFVRFFQQLVLDRLDVNSEHTCWFSQEVVKELARRYGLRIVDKAYVDDLYVYYRQRSILWRPIIGAHYLFSLIRPQMSETLCFALQAADTPNS